MINYRKLGTPVVANPYLNPLYIASGAIESGLNTASTTYTTGSEYLLMSGNFEDSTGVSLMIAASPTINSFIVNPLSINDILNTDSIIITGAGNGTACSSWVDFCLNGEDVNGPYNISGYDSFGLPVYTGGLDNNFKFNFNYSNGNEGLNLNSKFTKSYWQISQYKLIPNEPPWKWDNYEYHYRWEINQNQKNTDNNITGDWLDADYGSGTWVGVGKNEFANPTKNVLIYENGNINLLQNVLPNAKEWGTIAYGTGRWVAMPIDLPGNITSGATSTDNGRTWSGMSINNRSLKISKIVFNGINSWVMLAKDTPAPVVNFTEDPYDTVARYWNGICMSKDGKIQAAVATSDKIKISYDYGLKWSDVEGSRTWTSIAMSENGQYISANSIGGLTLKTSNFGQTWQPFVYGDTQYSRGIAMSTDGKVQTIPLYSSQYGILVSLDYGKNWSQKPYSNPWQGICMSNDGKIQAVTASNTSTYPGEIWMSVNSGNNWQLTSAPLKVWTQIKMSSGGKYISAITNVSSGEIWISNDSGQNWTATVSGHSFTSLIMSKDGALQTATSYTNGTGIVWNSYNYGQNWNRQLTGLTNWGKGAAMNYDGTLQILSQSYGKRIKLKSVTSEETSKSFVSNNGVNWSGNSGVLTGVKEGYKNFNTLTYGNNLWITLNSYGSNSDDFASNSILWAQNYFNTSSIGTWDGTDPSTWQFYDLSSSGNGTLFPFFTYQLVNGIQEYRGYTCIYGGNGQYNSINNGCRDNVYYSIGKYHNILIQTGLNFNYSGANGITGIQLESGLILYSNQSTGYRTYTADKSNAVLRNLGRSPKYANFNILKSLNTTGSSKWVVSGSGGFWAGIGVTSLTSGLNPWDVSWPSGLSIGYSTSSNSNTWSLRFTNDASEDGGDLRNNYIAIDTANTGSLPTLAFDNYFFLTSYTNQIGAYSTNGINWSGFTLTGNTNVGGIWQDLHFANGRFVAIPKYGTKFATSTNGTGWSFIAIPDSIQKDVLNAGFAGLTHDGKEWMVNCIYDSTTGQTPVLKSIDGVNWSGFYIRKDPNARIKWNSIVSDKTGTNLIFGTNYVRVLDVNQDYYQDYPEPIIKNFFPTYKEATSSVGNLIINSGQSAQFSSPAPFILDYDGFHYASTEALTKPCDYITPDVLIYPTLKQTSGSANNFVSGLVTYSTGSYVNLNELNYRFRIDTRNYSNPNWFITGVFATYDSSNENYIDYSTESYSSPEIAISGSKYTFKFIQSITESGHKIQYRTKSSGLWITTGATLTTSAVQTGVSNSNIRKEFFVYAPSPATGFYYRMRSYGLSSNYIGTFTASGTTGNNLMNIDINDYNTNSRYSILCSGSSYQLVDIGDKLTSN